MDACSYDKTNESLYRYQESVHGRIVNICDPLDRHLGISLFCHSRVYTRIKPRGLAPWM